GAIILSVINIFNIRERKYEIGVMAAIGMKKGKIATQFIIEMLVVTIITVIVGTGIGAAASVPVGNALLSAQTTSAQQQRENMNESFGRQPMEMGGGKAIDSSGNTGTQAAEVDGINTANSFVSQIHASTNLTVFAELMGIAILLSLISSGVAVIFVLRYDPLKILSNRD
ncbi:MAG: FtsX-like permease family protein, partial [Eubacterium sp.]